ncbi:UspA domain protein [Thermobaculum terrenum ATCC BAA-798]|uniref:UspA domain protein n=1 Tax=Thermobaculum terrenum (strain ATCC BAA-798 / CCMEE 7001 / YNP1) TaxID=525904 RepID=D1CCY5_THET1|nr:universal stress protein [Thermobaculum terrenum]ACZ42650.1 UspA domain protein [Thermobaculum terrenum ATCC BAA-798]
MAEAQFPRTLLLATDGLQDSALALDAALDLASRAGADLHVVHVWQAPPPFAPVGMVPVVVEDQSSEVESAARNLLEKEVEKVRSRGVTSVHPHLLSGRPAEEILSVARQIEADLIIIGSRGKSGLERLMMGSTSEEVVHHAHVPVLVLRGGADVWPPHKVVVGDDFSEEAERAAEIAAAIAKLLGCGLELITAYPTPVHPRRHPEVLSELLQSLQESSSQRSENLRGKFQVEVKPVVEAGDPAEVLLRHSDRDGEPTLVVVGARGLGAVQRMLLGSVSTKILRTSRNPVLVCPRPR